MTFAEITDESSDDSSSGDGQAAGFARSSDHINWKIVEKCGFYGGHQLKEIQHIYNPIMEGSLCRSWIMWIRIPFLVAMAWELLRPDSFAVLPNQRSRWLVFVGAVSFPLADILKVIPAIIFLKSCAVSEVLASGVEVKQSRWRIVDPVQSVLGIVLAIALFRPWVSIRRAMTACTGVLAVSFSGGGHVHNFVVELSKALINRFRDKLETGEPTTEILPAFCDLRDQLTHVWHDGFQAVAFAIGTNVVIAVEIALVGAMLAPVNPAAAVAVAMVGIWVASTIALLVFRCATVTAMCMSTDNDGLHGVLLEKTMRVMHIANVQLTSPIAQSNQSKVLANQSLMQMQRVLEVSKMGAKIGVIIDWKLLVTVVASSVASFGSILRTSFDALGQDPLANFTQHFQDN